MEDLRMMLKLLNSVIGVMELSFNEMGKTLDKASSKERSEVQFQTC